MQLAAVDSRWIAGQMALRWAAANRRRLRCFEDEQAARRPPRQRRQALGCPGNMGVVSVCARSRQGVPPGLLHVQQQRQQQQRQQQQQRRFTECLQPPAPSACAAAGTPAREGRHTAEGTGVSRGWRSRATTVAGDASG